MVIKSASDPLFHADSQPVEICRHGIDENEVAHREMAGLDVWPKHWLDNPALGQCGQARAVNPSDSSWLETRIVRRDLVSKERAPTQRVEGLMLGALSRRVQRPARYGKACEFGFSPAWSNPVVMMSRSTSLQALVPPASRTIPCISVRARGG